MADNFYLSLYVGQTLTLYARKYTASSDSDADDAAATWATSDATKVSVSTAGPSRACEITGVAPTAAASPAKQEHGEYSVTITITDGVLTATVQVAVTAAPVRPDQLLVGVGAE